MCVAWVVILMKAILMSDGRNKQRSQFSTFKRMSIMPLNLLIANCKNFSTTKVSPKKKGFNCS